MNQRAARHLPRRCFALQPSAGYAACRDYNTGCRNFRVQELIEHSESELPEPSSTAFARRTIPTPKKRNTFKKAFNTVHISLSLLRGTCVGRACLLTFQERGRYARQACCPSAESHPHEQPREARPGPGLHALFSSVSCSSDACLQIVGDGLGK